MSLEMLIDVLLASGSVLLACLVLVSRNVFTSILLYISLGLLVTIIWARLQAWDVAIAEAAIGTGLTGSLFLVTWCRLCGNNTEEQEK